MLYKFYSYICSNDLYVLYGLQVTFVCKNGFCLKMIQWHRNV